MTRRARPLRHRLAVAALFVLYLAAGLVDLVRRRAGGRVHVEREVF